MTDIDLVVFDWDGTLVDSTAAITDAIIEAASDLGLPRPTRRQASHVIGLGLHDALRRAVPELTERQLPEFVERYRHHYLNRDGDLRPFDGIPELLQTLSAAKPWVAVATGKSRIGLVRALEQTGWGRLFVTTRCADEGLPKPHPWMLQDICAELGVPAARTVMIGDTTHDLRMAHDAGARSVAVAYGAHAPEELDAWGTEAVLESVDALRAWLLPRLAI